MLFEPYHIAIWTVVVCATDRGTPPSGKVHAHTPNHSVAHWRSLPSRRVHQKKGIRATDAGWVAGTTSSCGREFMNNWDKALLPLPLLLLLPQP